MREKRDSQSSLSTAVGNQKSRNPCLRWLVSCSSTIAYPTIATWFLFAAVEGSEARMAPDDLKSLLGLLCPLSSFLGYLTPVGVVRDALLKSDSALIPVPVFVSGGLLNLLSVVYGVATNTMPLWATNLIGLASQVLFLALWNAIKVAQASPDIPDATELNREEKSVSAKKGPLSGQLPPPPLSFVLTCAFLGVCFVALSMVPLRAIGTAVCLQSVILSASPLSKLAYILQHRPPSPMPLSISLNMLLGSALWAAYGFVIRDHVILVPNVVGYVLSVYQVMVILWCRHQLPLAELDFMKGACSSHRRLLLRNPYSRLVSSRANSSRAASYVDPDALEAGSVDIVTGRPFTSEEEEYAEDEYSDHHEYLTSEEEEGLSALEMQDFRTLDLASSPTRRRRGYAKYLRAKRREPQIHLKPTATTTAAAVSTAVSSEPVQNEDDAGGTLE